MKTIVKLLVAVAVSVAVISCGDSLLPTEPASSTSSLKLHADEVTGPTLSTDKLDYMPGDTVTIYGSGWPAGETITLLLTEDAAIHEPLQWEVQADAEGNFTDSSFVVEDHDVGVKFTLTATGTSGATAQTTFTDGNFNVKTNAGTMVVSWQLFSTSINCTTGGGAVTSGVSVTSAGGLLVVATNTQSVQVAITSNPAGTNFVSWTNGGTTLNTTTICRAGSTGAQTWQANFVTPAATTTTVTANKSSPQEVGTSIAFTAQVDVTGGNAVDAGNVRFIEGGTCAAPTTTLQGATAVIASGGGKGSVTFTTSALPVGPHTITACYDGATAYLASTGSMGFTIDNIATSTVVTANKSSPQEVGVSTIFTATVTRANGPANVAVTTGNIGFYDGGSCASPGAELQAPGAVSGTGTKTFTTSSLSIAAHTILACFTPPTNFAASSGTLAFTITQIATTTTVTSDLTSPRLFGTTVVFTAEVNRTVGSADVLTGNVVFYDGGSCAVPGTTLQASQAVDGNGKVTYTTSTLSFGAHTILGCYLGTTDNATSSGTKAFTIEAIPTTTVITALPVSPSELGTSVTFTATVTRTTGGAAVTVGQVKFVEGGNCSATEVQAAANLNGSGQVTFTTSTLAVGGHNVRACYLPPAEYVASDDNTNYMISKIGTTSSVTADKTSPQDFGTSIVFTAEVNRTTGGADVTEGTFTFYDGGTDCTTTGTLLQAATTVDGVGKATLTTSALNPGVHTIFACYSGTPTYRGSTASMSFTINAIATTTAISALPVSPSELGTSVTFTATVTRTTGGAAVTVGQVKFVEGANCSATEVQAAANVDGSGQATFTTSTLTLGGHNIRACYLPTAEYVASNNAITYTIVNVATTSTLIADKTSPQSWGTSIVFTAEVNRTTGGADVTVGTFTFYDGGTDCTTTGTLLQAATTVDGVGKATLTTAALNPGVHTIFACYTGTAPYVNSAATKSFTINIISTTTTLTVTPSSQQYSDKVTLSAAISPTAAPGSVQFQKSVNGAAVFTNIGSAMNVVSGAASYDYTVVESSADAVQFKAVFTSSSVGYSGSSGTGSLTVTKEDATVTFDALNLAAMQVSSPGGVLSAGALSMKVLVSETLPDLAAATAAAGDIANAGLTVTLTPIGGGSAVALTCSSAVAAGVKTYTCTNPALVVNAYEVNATVTGNYYVGSGVDAFTVYDPSLGFATGGGHFLISGDKVTFGFVMKYNRGGTNLQGNFLAVRHLANGTIARIKSNSLGALALTDNGCGVASFDGKATYTYWSGGTYVNTGNNAFTVYAEDCNNPGTGVDKFWMSGPSLLNIASPVSTNKTTLTGGNIAVPHTPKV